MTRAQVNRAAACYHTFTALLLLLSGGGLLGLGIWLQVTSHGGPLDLAYGSNPFLDFILGAGILCIAIGGFILATAVSALIALGRRCVGKTFRVIYIILAVVVLALIVLVSVVSWMVFARRNTPAVKSFFKEAWERTVKQRPQAVCAIENAFKCRGFEETTCRTERCADCDALMKAEFLPGQSEVLFSISSQKSACYPKIRRDIRNIYLPTAIISTLLATFVLVDVFVVCAL